MQNIHELQPDVVIVGLGISGLYSAYTLAKKGIAVLAIQQFSHSGAIGTSSAGYTRIFRICSMDKQLQKIAPYDYLKWKQLQKQSNQKLIYMTGGLITAKKGTENQQKLIKSSSVTKTDNKQIITKYPSINLDQSYCCFQTQDMGFLDVKRILKTLKRLGQQNGVKFLYNCELKLINQASRNIQVKHEKQYLRIKYKRNLIMCCGPYTQNFLKQKNVQTIETQSIRITDIRGMPPVMINMVQNQRLYILPYNIERKFNKIGVHTTRSLKSIIQLLKKFFPNKISYLHESQPCFYVLRQTEGLKIFKKQDIIYAYGYSGAGFKHGPSIGKTVSQLIQVKPRL